VSSQRVASYPFTPRSNAYLNAGDLWNIDLSNGAHAAGVVVAPTTLDFGPAGSKSFIAGLLDWTGLTAPTPATCAGAGLLDWGSAHIKTITHEGGQILGRVDPAFRKIRKFGTGERRLNDVYTNGVRDTAAGPEDRTELPVASTWGFTVVNRIAERVIVRGLPLVG
jgi:hypothetical protein